MERTFRRALAILPGVLLLGACSDGVAPIDEVEEALVTSDVAAFVAASTGDDIGVMTLEAGEVMQPGMQMRGCDRNGFQRFRCARRAFRGDGSLTIVREVTFYADDVEQDDFDPVTTDSINFYTSIEGTREHGDMTASIDNERDFTVSGLEGEEETRTWNGTGSSEVNRTRVSDADGTREYDMSAATTVTDVVIPVPRDGQWPLSGMITRQVTVQIIRGDEVITRERNVVITFNGTQFPEMTVNGEPFELDLAERRARRHGQG